jgi:tRNA 2-thiouridine synthesizing protein A
VTDSPAQLGAPPPDRRSEAPNRRESTEATVVVDARGLLCPAPVIAAAKAARSLPAGSRLTVLATDPAAAVDVPAWARMRGHQVLETTEDGEHLVLTVLLGPATAR